MNTAARRKLPAALAVATAALVMSGGVMSGGIASAADTPTGPDTTSTNKTTWSVQPSSATGPTTRTSFDYTVVPGTDLVDYAGVNNYSNKPLTLDVYATDAFNTDTGGTDLLAGAQKPVDVGAWVKFPKRHYTIAANSRADIPFRVAVPTNASPGDHVGGVVASLQAVTSDGKSRDVTVDRRVGTRLNLRVQGPLDPKLEVTNLKASYEGSVDPLGGKLTLTYDVENSGNVQLAAHQKVQIKALGLVGVKSADLPDLGRILPGNKVTLTETIDGVPAAVVLDTKLSLVPISTRDMEITLTTSSASASSLAIPWSVLIALIVLLIGGWGVRRVRRRRKAKAAATLAAAVEAARAEERAAASQGSAAQGVESAAPDVS